MALVEHLLGYGAIEIVTAQRRTARGKGPERRPLQPQQRENRNAATKIVDGVEAFVLIEAVGQRGCGRLSLTSRNTSSSSHPRRNSVSPCVPRRRSRPASVMTARSTGFSSAASARARNVLRISAEISTGERGLPPIRNFDHVGLTAARLDLVGQHAGNGMKIGCTAPHQPLFTE